MTRWLRHKQDGTIYEWDRYLAAHPKLEEVSEEIAFPEKFLTPGISARVAQFSEEVPAAEEVAEVVAALEAATEEPVAGLKVSRKGRKRKGVDLHTDDIPEEPEYSNPELNAEASRGLL
jgi:hypothetical protein